MLSEDTYLDWIHKWRKWKNAWYYSEDVVVEFCIQFIPIKGYNMNHHAQLCSRINDIICRSTINKDGIMIIGYGSGRERTIRILNKCESFNIISISLDMFTRKEILIVAKILEEIGHGVIHNGGFISTGFDIGNRKYKMPFREDPIWDMVILDNFK